MKIPRYEIQFPSDVVFQLLKIEFEIKNIFKIRIRFIVKKIGF